MSSDNQLKVSRRLKEATAPEVVEFIYKPRLETDFSDSFRYLNEINQAHLLMLDRCRLLKAETVRVLAAARGQDDPSIGNRT